MCLKYEKEKAVQFGTLQVQIHATLLFYSLIIWFSTDSEASMPSNLLLQTLLATPFFKDLKMKETWKVKPGTSALLTNYPANVALHMTVQHKALFSRGSLAVFR